MTSPQAFDGLRMAGRSVRRPDHDCDHGPQRADGARDADAVSRRQMEALSANCEEFGIPLFPMGSIGQGIVHVIGPQMG